MNHNEKYVRANAHLVTSAQAFTIEANRIEESHLLLLSAIAFETKATKEGARFIEEKRKARALNKSAWQIPMSESLARKLQSARALRKLGKAKAPKAKNVSAKMIQKSALAHNVESLAICKAEESERREAKAKAKKARLVGVVEKAEIKTPKSAPFCIEVIDTKKQRSLNCDLEARKDALTFARFHTEKAIRKMLGRGNLGNSGKAPSTQSELNEVRNSISRNSSKTNSVEDKTNQVIEESESAFLFALASDLETWQMWKNERKLPSFDKLDKEGNLMLKKDGSPFQTVPALLPIYKTVDREFRRMSHNANIENWEECYLKELTLESERKEKAFARTQLPTFAKALSIFWKNEIEQAKAEKRTIRSQYKNDLKKLTDLLLNPSKFFEGDRKYISKNYQMIAKRVNYGCALGEIDNCLPSKIDLRKFNSPKVKATV